MDQLNFTIDCDIKKFLAQDIKNESIKKLYQLFLNQILKFQSDEQIGIAKYKRDGKRKDYRNGFYQRNLKSCYGLITLDVPRHRHGNFKTEIFERFKHSEQNLLTSMLQMVIDNNSTKKIENIIKELCGLSYSTTTIANICQELSATVNKWKNCDLN